jgi:hypothetical protein
MNSGVRVIKARQKAYKDNVERKLDEIDNKLAVVTAEVLPPEHLVERKRAATGRQKENDVLEVEVREEAREIQLRTAQLHIGAMAGYMERIHGVLEDVNPSQQDLPNYVEMLNSIAQLGEKVLDLKKEAETSKVNPQQINLALLAGNFGPVPVAAIEA